MSGGAAHAMATGRWLVVLAAILGLGLAFASGSATAQSAVPDTAVAAASEQPVQAPRAGSPGLWSRTLAYVRTQQRQLHRELAGAIRTLRNEGSATAAWSLIVLSFLYGVFHAAGPGHGKAIISAYLLTHESAVRRGLWLSAAAALVQGLTAIILVEVLVALIGWTRKDAQAAAGTLESVSFALIALLGLALTARALWSLRHRILPSARTAPSPVATVAAGHSGAAGHDAPACSHRHAPDPGQLDQPLSLKSFAAIVLSIGIRPCSGSILVLLFAEALGLRWAGITAVLAISLGTAITVGVLAVLAVNFRRLAAAAAGGSVGNLAVAGHAVALLGGVVITWLGASLFLGSLGGGHPLL